LLQKDEYLVLLKSIISFTFFFAKDEEEISGHRGHRRVRTCKQSTQFVPEGVAFFGSENSQKTRLRKKDRKRRSQTDCSE